MFKGKQESKLQQSTYMYTKLVTTHPNKENMSGEISKIKVPDLTHTPPQKREQQTLFCSITYSRHYEVSSRTQKAIIKLI